ncbi:MAG: AI-2E family transporter [Spirochaetia bacterium]|nr:AI-2E family transporter [Spirochaetia bacterium]
MDIKKKYSFLDITRLLPWLFLVIFLVFLFLVFIVYRSYLMSFFAAGILYLLFRQPHELFLRYMPENQNLTAAISVIFVFLAVMLPLTYIAVSIVTETSIAVNHLREILTKQNIEEFYGKNLWIKDWVSLETGDLRKFQTQILEMSREIGITVFSSTQKILSGSFKITVNFFLALVILFFFFRGGEKISEVIYKNLPFPREIEKQIGEKILNVLDAVVKGNLLISVIQGIMIGLLFWIFGLSTPVLYGSLAAFFALIPVVGTMIIWLPASIYLYSTESAALAISLAALAFGIYFILENIVKPNLLDKKLKLHPLFLFLALLGGLTEFGVKGLILGPFFVTVFLTLWELLRLWNTSYGKME